MSDSESYNNFPPLSPCRCSRDRQSSLCSYLRAQHVTQKAETNQKPNVMFFVVREASESLVGPFQYLGPQTL